MGASTTSNSGTGTPPTRHAVDIAGAIELVGALRLGRWRRHADDLFAVVEDQSHREFSYVGVGAQLPDADHELREAVIHAAHPARGTGHLRSRRPKPPPRCSGTTRSEGALSVTARCSPVGTQRRWQPARERGVGPS